MDVVFTHCAGLDVHKKSITACRIVPDPTGQEREGVAELQTFGTMTSALLTLVDWLTATVKLQFAVLPEASVAVQVTVVTPTGKQEPAGGLQTTVTPGQLSVATGGGKVTVTQAPVTQAL